MRRAAKVDANHAEIVSALEEAGAQVTSLATVGNGVADLLVSWNGAWSVIEVKDGKKAPSARQLTKLQKHWMSRQNAMVYVVTNPMEALEALAAVRKEISWREAMREDA
jgi:hypothetical protein